MTDRADMSGHFTHFVRRRKRLEGRTDTDMCLRTCPLSAPTGGPTKHHRCACCMNRRHPHVES